MPIAREGGFHVTHDLAHVTCVGIESSRLEACLARVKRDRTKGVFGHPRFGFTGQDLDFLADMPWIEVVWFWDIDLQSIDGLYALGDLQHFGVHPRRPPLDFSRFPRLRRVTIEPRARDRGLGALPALEVLHVWHFRPRDRTFSALEFPSSLVELEINWANAASLDSLPALPRLRRLEVHRCRNLESLGDLGRKFPHLEHLVVAACGKVRPAEGERVVRDLPELSHAYVQDIRYRPV
jgi:hypothetical protein